MMIFIFIINDLIKILDFLKDNPNFLIIHSKDIKVIKKRLKQFGIKEMAMVFFCIIIIYLTMSYISPKINIYLKENIIKFNKLDIQLKVFMILIFSLILWFIDRLKKKKSGQIKQGIIVEGIELERYESVIKEYCQ